MGRRSIALLGLALWGCAVPRVYTPPTENLEAHSRIVLRNTVSELLYARLFDEPLTCSKPVNFTPGGAMKGMTRGETQVVYARKGEPFTVAALYGFSRVQCHVHATFVPTADAYELLYSATANLRECTLLAIEAGRERRPVPKDRIFLRPFNVPLFQSGPWCRALPESAREALGVRANK